MNVKEAISSLMSMIKKNMLVVAVLVIAVGLYFFASKYSASKLLSADGYSNTDGSGNSAAAASAASHQQPAAAAAGTPPSIAPEVQANDSTGAGQYSSVDGSSEMMQQPSSYATRPVNQPADLLPLPVDQNSNWSSVNPMGAGDLANVNLLNAGYFNGIDTIGQTMKNANLQIRSDPPIPKMETGPWNQSTNEADLMRVPFELGSA